MKTLFQVSTLNGIYIFFEQLIFSDSMLGNPLAPIVNVIGKFHSLSGTITLQRGSKFSNQHHLSNSRSSVTYNKQVTLHISIQMNNLNKNSEKG